MQIIQISFFLNDQKHCNLITLIKYKLIMLYNNAIQYQKNESIDNSDLYLYVIKIRFKKNSTLGY